MKLTTAPAANSPATHLAEVRLVADTRSDARLLGILSRLIACGVTPSDGLLVLLEIINEKARGAER